MSERRNFRSYYYEKMGFRGVEEKKSLEILLKEDPVDIAKLSTFCTRFPVPAMFRPLVWKLVLGILPPHPSIHQFVLQQRMEQFNDLKHGLEVMSAIGPDTPPSLCFLKMYLLDEGRLPLEEEKLPETEEEELFMSIAKVVMEMSEDDEMDAFWTAVSIFRHLQGIQEQIRSMPSTFKASLKKADPSLFNHLAHAKALDRLPFTSWFNALFAGVLPTITLERIWDRVIGGASRVLVFVAVMYVMTHRTKLLTLGQTDQILQFLRQVPWDNSEVLVCEAIELWEKDGSHLRPEPAVT
ncbi:TBC1 domain family member 7-like [Diadema antillarum]|uniref:TBC1 domain family member 7-like n=2 Tax=Diadema antillarum TaxID=105358 RepID=UPI003A8B9874